MQVEEMHCLYVYTKGISYSFAVLRERPAVIPELYSAGKIQVFSFQGPNARSNKYVTSGSRHQRNWL